MPLIKTKTLGICIKNIYQQSNKTNKNTTYSEKTPMEKKYQSKLSNNLQITKLIKTNK